MAYDPGWFRHPWQVPRGGSAWGNLPAAFSSVANLIGGGRAAPRSPSTFVQPASPSGGRGGGGGYGGNPGVQLMPFPGYGTGRRDILARLAIEIAQAAAAKREASARAAVNKKQIAHNKKLSIRDWREQTAERGIFTSGIRPQGQRDISKEHALQAQEVQVGLEAALRNAALAAQSARVGSRSALDQLKFDALMWQMQQGYMTGAPQYPWSPRPRSPRRPSYPSYGSRGRSALGHYG